MPISHRKLLLKIPLAIAVVAALVCAAFLAVVHAGAEPLVAKHLSVELVANQTALVPGQPAQVGFNWKLDSGWHIYWKNAGDSGEPPDAKWTLPAGITAGDIAFPAPKRLPLGPLMDFGYEDAVLLPVPLNVASTVKTGTSAVLTANLRWLVCREVCLPGKGTVTLTLPVAETASPSAAAPLFANASKSMPAPPPGGVQIKVAQDKSTFVIELLTGQAEGDAQFFPTVAGQVKNAGAQPIVKVSNGLLLAVPKDDALTSAPASLQGILELSGGRNYAVDVPAATDFGALPDGARAKTFAATASALSGSAGATEAVASGKPAPGTHVATLHLGGLLRFTLLAFFGGVILNLMPCVFPVLFLKGLSLVQTQGQERSEARAHGLLYMLGILVSFWAIAGVLIVLRSGGAAFGWGFQFQSPVFVALVTLLLFFFAMSLAGQFDVGLSLTSTGGSLADKKGPAGSFFTGVLATIVATPCTAPFMGPAIGFALSQSAFVSLMIFTAIALGLAAPYVALTLAPQWAKHLPAPGAWMEVLKQAAAVPIFGTVIWLTWLFAKLTGIDHVTDLLVALLVLAVAGWALGRWPARRGSTVAATLLVALAIAIPVYGLRAAAKKPEWQPWSQAAVDQARAEHKPVFVDFTAAWCLSCQVTERIVLNSTAVQKALTRSSVVRLRADWTQYDPAITNTLASLGRDGVPTYVVYSADPATPPNVLPETPTEGIVVSAVEQAAK